MRILFVCAFLPGILPLFCAQGGVPTFQYRGNDQSYTLVGGNPAKGGTTTIPTVVVPISLVFEAGSGPGRASEMNAAPDIHRLLKSPVFTPFPFATGKMQHADALLRTTFPKAGDWHTKFTEPEILKPVVIRVPSGFGYTLVSHKTGRSAAIADIEFVQKELSKQLPKQENKLVLAITHNTAYYTEGDATICCSWGTHGIDSATGNSFILASYLSSTPSVVEDQDVQPLTQQLGEFLLDPLHDPLIRQANHDAPGNRFPAWLRPASMRPGDQGRCGGTRVASAYFLLEPTDTNRKNNFPTSKPFVATTPNGAYHLENVALLPWYLGPSADLALVWSFPDANALSAGAQPCPSRDMRRPAPRKPDVPPAPLTGAPNGHQLIGYWSGYGGPGSTFPLTEISPQWDVIIVAFATPDQNAEEGTLTFHAPVGLDPEQFKADVAAMKQHGKKVMISLGGGGQFFSLDDPKHISNFVSSVGDIVRTYGFDGVDIDFESPSLEIAAGDTDFTHPTTPSIVNLIAGLRQLRDEFGPSFMISLVPEGTQIPAGHSTYGGQFGSYLPIAYGLRDILSFMDVQDYNTPPIEGLDGEIYQAGTLDYHAAVTELVLRGFSVGGKGGNFFSPLPEKQAAVGFLIGETTPPIVQQAMDYIITGKAPAGTRYKLLRPRGYRDMIGAMFWTIDADRGENYRFSNTVGPQLHGYPVPK